MTPKHVSHDANASLGENDIPSISTDPYSTTAEPGAFRAAYVPQSGASNGSGHGRSTASSNPYSRNNASHYAVKPKKKHRRGKKIALVTCLVLAVVLVGVGVAAALYVNNLDSQMAEQDTEQAAAIQEELTTPVSDEPFYVMLIGSDTRDDGTGQRSDTNIVARVDLSTATVTLISIPRDTAIDLDGYGTQKFNAAYNYGGAAGSIKEAKELLGVDISHYAEIDFNGVVDLIDALGGVEVDVPMEITDADAGGHVDQGLQTLDGEHALIFARSRSYTTGDFQRTTNQRILIEAVINKIMSLPATELPGIVQKMAACVTTDMKVTDIVGYAQAFQKAGNLTMYSALIPSTTADLDGVSYVVCDTAQLSKMMTAVNAGEDPAPYSTDYTVSSSAEADASGAEATPVYSYSDTGESFDWNSTDYDPYATGEVSSSSSYGTGYDASGYSGYDTSGYSSSGYGTGY